MTLRIYDNCVASSCWPELVEIRHPRIRGFAQRSNQATTFHSFPQIVQFATQENEPGHVTSRSNDVLSREPFSSFLSLFFISPSTRGFIFLFTSNDFELIIDTCLIHDRKKQRNYSFCRKWKWELDYSRQLEDCFSCITLTVITISCYYEIFNDINLGLFCFYSLNRTITEEFMWRTW